MIWRLVILCLGVAAGGAAASADPLKDQLHALRIENRMELLGPSAAVIALSPSEVPNEWDPDLRDAVASDLATRRGLADISSGKWQAASPNITGRARSLLFRADVETATAQDPVIAAAVALRTARLNRPEMVGSEGQVGVGGGVTPVDRGPGAAPPIPASALAREQTANQPPDLFQLPFSMAFVVELRLGNVHCTGALIGPTTVLTARHCVVDGSGQPVDGQSITIRSGVGGTVRRGRQGLVWVLHADPGDESDDRYRDVALVSLDGQPDGSAVYAKVSPVGPPLTGDPYPDLWVMMAGFGYTDVSAPNLGGWNPAYLARQVVDFGSFTANLPAVAAIPWENTTDRPASQCAGDSGGPVFVVGRTGVPLIVGVLSRSNSGEPDSVTACRNSSGAAFINFGHPFVHDPICRQLQQIGTPCFAPLDYVVRQSPA